MRSSIWQWSPRLSKANLPKISSGTTSRISKPQDIQFVTIQRRFSSYQQPAVRHLQEIKSLRHRTKELYIDILQEGEFKPRVVAKSNLERQFKHLAKQWENETGMLSDLSQKVIHPAYQRIIGMGQDAVPLLLSELSERPNHWFWALRSITGINPVKPENRGRIKLMARDWICWGRDHGYEF